MKKINKENIYLNFKIKHFDYLIILKFIIGNKCKLNYPIWNKHCFNNDIDFFHIIIKNEY